MPGSLQFAGIPDERLPLARGGHQRLDDKIILKKYNPADIFTGEDMDDLIDYKGKKVSRKSIIELAKLAGFEITEA